MSMRVLRIDSRSRLSHELLLTAGCCEVAVEEDPEAVEAADAAEAVLSLLSSQNPTASPDSSDSHMLSSESNYGEKVVGHHLIFHSIAENLFLQNPIPESYRTKARPPSPEAPHLLTLCSF